MLTKSKANKAPKLYLPTGKSAFTLRKKLRINQRDFWSRIQVTQSGGSRYESGRNLPAPVQLLLHLTYAPTARAHAMLSHLRVDEKS